LLLAAGAADKKSGMDRKTLNRIIILTRAAPGESKFQVSFPSGKEKRMTSHAVHWYEGMFLRPHHFQAAHRHLTDLGRRNHSWDLQFNWGLRSIDLDHEALANQRLVVHALEARLRDGTPVIIPDDGALAPLDLRLALQGKTGHEFTVFLAVPTLYPGRRNIGAQRQAELRFYEQCHECDDENEGGNPQTVPLRAPNFQILLGEHDQPGYEAIPIARLEKSAQADARLQLDPSFIPPLLSCDAWKPLADGILHALGDRLDKKVDWLVQQIASQGITFDRQAPGDALVLKQLQQLNEAVCVLNVLLAAPGIHPLQAYLELSRIVGQLAIFGATRRPPDLPSYDHDNLGVCFGALKQHLDTQLDIVVEPEYKERAFVGAGARLQLALEPRWLDVSWRMFIGVQSNLDTPQCIALLTKSGQLDMKVGSSERVDQLYRQGATGLRFVAETIPPKMLPAIPGQVYFQLLAEPGNPEWVNVKKSLTLAVRLNERLIVGTIQNQRRITVRSAGRNVTMQFSLYVVPQTTAREPYA
jgi:type VI secretion system protein ImpJ